MKTFIAMLVAAGLALAATAGAKETAAAAEGSKGTLVGRIIKKDGPKITVKGEGEALTLMPYWRGGMPKDGGGFDKEMIARLKTFETGDRVKVTWTFQEHHRIDSIERLKGGGEREREERRKE